MELGATVCTPRGAKCGGCPLADICAAKREDRVDALPVKGEKRARKIEERTVFFLECDGEVAICRRPPRGQVGQRKRRQPRDVPQPDRPGSGKAGVGLGPEQQVGQMQPRHGQAQDQHHNGVGMFIFHGVPLS